MESPSSRNNSIASLEMDEDALAQNMANEPGTRSLRRENQTSVNNSLRPNLMSVVHHKWRKMWKRDSAEITQSDPSYKAVYLGNVVTTWAKGEGCLERPASALWKNHCQGRGSIKMVISVAPSGLKAQTREHGLTEYWANRLTWCGVPPDYPKLFCWIYRHEGRKLKQELRCHAVLCAKEDRAQRLAISLRNRLAEALFDFKKEKILRQNARLSIVQSLYNTSATKRKLLLLNTNSQNYKPPLERSKSAPKLSCIEEFEEEEDENEENISLYDMTILESESENMPVVTSPSEMHSTAPIPILRNGDVKARLIPIEDRSPSSLKNHTDEERGSPIPIQGSPKIENSIEHRNSYTHPVIHHPQGSRRPHTVPMDAKLNLPYMTGYDKVMHLLDMPTGDTHHRLLDEDDEEFSYPFASPNSDPIASSPGSDASESVNDSCCEDEYGKHMRRRGSCNRKNTGDCSPEEREDEINDNVSDESGYSEEVMVIRKMSNGDAGLSLNHHPSGSPILKKSSTKNSATSTIIIGENEPIILDAMSACPKTSTTTTTVFKSDANGGPPTTCMSTTTLVVYDNLCFEI